MTARRYCCHSTKELFRGLISGEFRITAITLISDPHFGQTIGSISYTFVSNRAHAFLETRMLPKKEGSHSNYDWMNIDLDTVRVGKVRGKINRNILIIFSINIFPEFERHGFASETVRMFKKEYKTIIADRVRPTAVGFWEKMGFIYHEDGNYIWKEKTR